MFIAIYNPATREVLEVATNEAASLEAMAVYVERERNVNRIATTAAVFAAYSAGRCLVAEDSLNEAAWKMETHIVVA